MFHCHIPVLLSVLPCSKSPFLLLGWHLFPIHCLHGSSALASEASWQVGLIALDTVQCLGTYIARTRSSPVIHIRSSTKFPQVWEGTNFSGSFLCAWGTHKIQLDPPASRETWLCGIFSSPQAAGISLHI